VNAGKLKQLFPRISRDVLRLSAEAGEADIQSHDPGPAPFMEPNPGDGAVGKVPVQKGTGRKFFIRVTAIRTRLLDWDNLCEKYHVDLLRYASAGVFGDSPATTQIEVRQEKAQAGEREEVRLEVFEV